MTIYYCPETGERLGNVGEISAYIIDREQYHRDASEHDLQLLTIQAKPITKANVRSLKKGDVVTLDGWTLLVSSNNVDSEDDFFADCIMFKYSPLFLKLD